MFSREKASQKVTGTSNFWILHREQPFVSMVLSAPLMEGNFFSSCHGCLAILGFSYITSLQCFCHLLLPFFFSFWTALLRYNSHIKFTLSKCIIQWFLAIFTVLELYDSSPQKESSIFVSCHFLFPTKFSQP